MKQIQDINDPDIKEFISLRQSSVDEKHVVVESKNVFKKLFSKNIKIHKLFCTEENLTFINEHCKSIDFPIYIANNEVMKKIVGHKIHQGMMALIDKPKFISYEQIKGDVVVLNSLTSPENVGSIVRSCAAFGVKNIIIDSKTTSPFLRRCIRVSTGNIFNINVYKSENLIEDLKKLQHEGYSLISTALSERTVSLRDFTFAKKSLIVIGNEGHGVDKEVMDISDNLLKINIDDEVTSLNASIAASIVLYQLNIQQN